MTITVTVTIGTLKEFTDLNHNPVDMIEEISNAITNEKEDSIVYENRNGTAYYCYFPKSKRGGVCSNELTNWTDCHSLDNLEDRWNNYDEQWRN